MLSSIGTSAFQETLMSNVVSAIACVPGAIAPGDRAAHFSLAHSLFHDKADERRELPEGYAFRFREEEFDAVARFVANERKCCPFVDFEITLTRESGELWLRMSGPPGTRSVLEAELSLQRGCACSGSSP
jgi:hypothetical protein